MGSTIYDTSASLSSSCHTSQVHFTSAFSIYIYITQISSPHLTYQAVMDSPHSDFLSPWLLILGAYMLSAYIQVNPN